MKRGVELGWQTPRAWAGALAEDVLALLSDHAHCELGAAAAAQGFIARAVGDAALVERMAALAVEELRHFRQVHRLLRDLGGELEPVRKNPYVEGLMRSARRDTRENRGLLDRLLVAALVEARSLERFELMAELDPGEDAGLARVTGLYAELAPSEAGHAQLFVELARERFPTDEVEERFAVLTEREGALIEGLPFATRIHSGPPVQTRPEVVEKSRGSRVRAVSQP